MKKTTDPIRDLAASICVAPEDFKTLKLYDRIMKENRSALVALCGKSFIEAEHKNSGMSRNN